MNPKILIILSLFAILMQSCFNRDRYHRLTEVDKQMIPYKLGQVVTFIDSLGQSIVLTVTHDKITSGPLDEAFHELYERRTVILESEIDNYRIYLDVTKYMNQVDIYINQFDFHGSQNYNKEGDFYGQYFYDNMEINNKIYYNVGQVFNYQDSLTLFYNKTEGILQLNDNNKALLTLDN
jgi:hypothetical protein